MNWLSKKNGELLSLMDEEGFEYLITTDRNLEFQQNLSQFNVRIVVLYLHDNKEDSILPYAQIIEAKILTAPEDLRVIPIDLKG